MQFILNRHLLKSSFFWILAALNMIFIQAARDSNDQAKPTIDFWLKKVSKDEVGFVESNEYKAIGEELTAGTTPANDQYLKKTYEVEGKSVTCIWVTVMQLIQHLNIKVKNPWLNLNLILVYKGISVYDQSEIAPLNGNNLVGLLSKFANVRSNMTIIIAKKEGDQKKSIKMTVDEGNSKPLEKKLMVYPTTTLGDLMCYLVYHSDMPQAIKNELECDLSVFNTSDKNYTLTTQKNNKQELENKLLVETVDQMKSSQFTWARKQCLCKFYLNQDGSLLSLEQIGFFDQKKDKSNKIKKGIEGKWKCVQKSIGKGKLFFPFIAALFPDDISTMDIMYNILRVDHNTYQLSQRSYTYTSDTTTTKEGKIHSTAVSPITIVNAQVNKPCSLVLSAYDAENKTNMRCILKQNGKLDQVILEKLLPINQAERGKELITITYFVEVYLELMRKAGYLIDEVSSYPAKITYTTNNSTEEKVVTKNMYNSVADHQKEVHATTYTFVMPKSAKLIKAKIQSQNNNSNLDNDTKSNQGNSSTDLDTNDKEINVTTKINQTSSSEKLSTESTQNLNQSPPPTSTDENKKSDLPDNNIEPTNTISTPLTQSSETQFQNNNPNLVDDDQGLKQRKKSNQDNSSATLPTESTKDINQAPSLESTDENNNDKQDKSNINLILKYAIISCIVVVALSFVGYLTWKSKKRAKKVDS